MLKHVRDVPVSGGNEVSLWADDRAGDTARMVHRRRCPVTCPVKEGGRAARPCGYAATAEVHGPQGFILNVCARHAAALGRVLHPGRFRIVEVRA